MAARACPVAVILLAACSSKVAHSAPFASTSVLVTRLGDGSTTGTSGTAAAATFVDEYSQAGSLLQSVAFPTSGADVTTILYDSSGKSEGGLAVSGDGCVVALAGFAVTPGSTVGTSGTARERVKAFV
jgi:hypothetical protein